MLVSIDSPQGDQCERIAASKATTDAAIVIASLHVGCGTGWGRRVEFRRRRGELPCGVTGRRCRASRGCSRRRPSPPPSDRSEEHTSELQSRENLVCRLLLEKKKKKSE